jgi:peptide chain release factor 1
VLERLDELEAELARVEADLADPLVLADPSRLKVVSRRHKELAPIIDLARRYRARLEDVDAARELAVDAAGDDRELVGLELTAAEADVARLEDELRELLLPADPDAGKHVIVEIRGAEGGEEANLFARDLFTMYQGYAERRRWKLEVLSLDPSDLGGLNQVTMLVRGDDAWSRLRFEGGPHRVQRVPVTESSGRIHTSSATVSVLPEADELEVDLAPDDLEIDVYRASGAGGQHVNKTESAVRITHRPTGIVVAMQDERSQLQNRARALQVLRARVLRRMQDEQAATLSAERRAQVGGGGRSEKIRTYNFKENRVTDHRLGLTLYRLQQVLAGDLDEIVDALIADDRAKHLAATAG